MWTAEVTLSTTRHAPYDALGRAVAVANGAAWVGAPRQPAVGTPGVLFVYVGIEDCDGNGVTDLVEVGSGAAADVNENGRPDVCESVCPGDVDGSGFVDGNDLNHVVSRWGEVSPEADLDGSGMVDFGDLNLVLDNWGAAC